MSDEKPVKAKSTYYFPEEDNNKGVHIEADTYEEAVAKLKQHRKGDK